MAQNIKNNPLMHASDIRHDITAYLAKHCKFFGFIWLVLKRLFLNTIYFSVYLSSVLPPDKALFNTTKPVNW